jgi:flagellum-specific peptidoglycan hydrolase FlgJ
MNRLPAPFQEFGAFRIGTYTVQELTNRHWYKVIMLLIIAYVFTQKNISFSVNTQDAGSASSDIAMPPQSSPVAASIGSPRSLANSPKLMKAQTETEEASVVGGLLELGAAAKSTSKAKSAPVGNTMSNLAPVLNPNYIKKHHISKEIVAEKMQTCQMYIDKFAAAAVREMHLYGIPASVTLAQGLLESNAGQSLLASKANNHFGIKCFSKTCKRGHCMNASDDTHKDFFRMYPNAGDCYHAHSEFLQADRYKWLKKYPKNDYKNWAKGLKKSGYATAPHYAEALITIVETLDLEAYDKK